MNQAEAEEIEKFKKQIVLVISHIIEVLRSKGDLTLVEATALLEILKGKIK